MFDKFGSIKLIKYCETENFKFWRLWIEYIRHEDALSAYRATLCDNMKCKLTRAHPKTDVDVVYPERVTDDEEEIENMQRSPLPARWHIVTTKSEFCNFFHFKKHLN